MGVSMDKLFQIGDFCFRLLCPEAIPLPSNFLPFEIKQGRPEYTYRLSIADTLPQPDEKIIAKRQDLIVYEVPAGESRLIGVRGQNTFYACYQEVSEQQANVILSFHEIKDLHFDPVFISLFALERQMIKRDSLILHCAYIEYQGKAILFSAPSETGKTTQAELWERYKGSHTVNGDRALLRKINKQWTACSWPVSGSSGVCNLGDTPIHAIIMLGQGKTNRIERLSPVQAFLLLYAQITINQWNSSFVQRAITDLEELIEQVPVYQLTCNMTQDAVQCVATELFPTADKKQ